MQRTPNARAASISPTGSCPIKKGGETMLFFCDECIKLFTDAGFGVERDREIPERTAKCDGCNRLCRVKSVYLKRGD